MNNKPGLIRCRALYISEAKATELFAHLGKNVEIVISRYGLFKDYLQRRIPLTNINIATWYPSKALVGAIFTELLVYEEDFDLFYDSFMASYEKSAAEPHLIPKFFFNFIKKNEIKILEKGFERKRQLN